MKRSGLKRRAPLRKKGESAEDALWRDARLATLERDHYTCQGIARGLAHDCPIEDWVHVHHIVRRSQGGSDHPANLVTLCRTAHDLVHANPAHAYKLGLLQRSGDALCARCSHVARLHSVTFGTCTYGAYGLECGCPKFMEPAA